MKVDISSVRANGPQWPDQTPLGQGTKETGLKDAFARYLSEVNELQGRAAEAVRDMATGKVENLHQVVAAVNEADLSFRLMMQMRNRLTEAYKEIMRMQV